MSSFDEKKKWDTLYSATRMIEMTAEEIDFNEELAESISALLPSNASILEAGCGRGGQSLALAKRGFRVTLMDFSKEALSHAKDLFARHGVEASFVQADIISHRPKLAEFDLVFNAGVLEHYSVEEQEIFLRSMASYSREYVLVLVPNRMCYWYWVWRSRQVANGNWPYGKEIPLGDLSSLFKAVDISFVGQKFMASTWTESFIKDIFRTEHTLYDEILRVHRSPVVEASSKSYLLAGLGTIKPIEDHASHDWVNSGRNDEMKHAQMQSALSDALALLIGAQRTAQEKRLFPRIKRTAKRLIQSVSGRR